MKMEVLGDTVRISDVKELGSANANAFRDWVRSSLENGQRNIELDLSQELAELREELEARADGNGRAA